MNKDISIELLGNGTKVYTDKIHRFGSDALLLSEFCAVDKAKRICELGSGCGIILLNLYDMGFRGEMTAVEISERACLLMEKAVKDNGIENCCVENADMRRFRTGRPFDVVISNPPYFSGGLRAADSERAAARHLIEGSINDWCETAAAVLKNKGRFYLCYPPAYLPSLFTSLCKNKLAPKNMAFVKNSNNGEAWLCLIEARKGQGHKEFNPDGLKIMPDLILERCVY